MELVQVIIVRLFLIIFGSNGGESIFHCVVGIKKQIGGIIYRSKKFTYYTFFSSFSKDSSLCQVHTFFQLHFLLIITITSIYYLIHH